jgi:hypothetical protein
LKGFIFAVFLRFLLVFARFHFQNSKKEKKGIFGGMRFYWGRKNVTNKKTCFMLIFLDLKSKAIHLFLVASILR